VGILKIVVVIPVAVGGEMDTLLSLWHPMEH